MAKREKQKPISVVFLMIFAVTVIGMLAYAFAPNDIKKIKSKKNFDEMLEYNHRYINQDLISQRKQKFEQTKTVVSSEDLQIKNKRIVSSESVAKNIVKKSPVQSSSYQPKNKISREQQKKEEYNSLSQNYCTIQN